MCPTRTVTPSDVGRIHSPAFADNYGPNLNCKLTLDVPSNKKVEIMYNHRDIECKYSIYSVLVIAVATLLFSVLVVVVFFVRYCSCFAVLFYCIFLFYGYFRLLLFLFVFVIAVVACLPGMVVLAFVVIAFSLRITTTECTSYCFPPHSCFPFLCSRYDFRPFHRCCC